MRNAYSICATHVSLSRPTGMFQSGSIDWPRLFGRCTLCGGVVCAALCRVLGERDAKKDGETSQSQKGEWAAPKLQRAAGNDGSRSRLVPGCHGPPAQTVARTGAPRACIPARREAIGV